MRRRRHRIKATASRNAGDCGSSAVPRHSPPSNSIADRLFDMTAKGQIVPVFRSNSKSSTAMHARWHSAGRAKMTGFHSQPARVWERRTVWAKRAAQDVDDRSAAQHPSTAASRTSPPAETRRDAAGMLPLGEPLTCYPQGGFHRRIRRGLLHESAVRGGPSRELSDRLRRAGLR